MGVQANGVEVRFELRIVARQQGHQLPDPALNARVGGVEPGLEQVPQLAQARTRMKEARRVKVQSLTDRKTTQQGSGPNPALRPLRLILLKAQTRPHTVWGEGGGGASKARDCTTPRAGPARDR